MLLNHTITDDMEHILNFSVMTTSGQVSCTLAHYI